MLFFYILQQIIYYMHIFALGITEETLISEMHIWCSKIDIINVFIPLDAVEEPKLYLSNAWLLYTCVCI